MSTVKEVNGIGIRDELRERRKLRRARIAEGGAGKVRKAERDEQTGNT